MPVWAGPPHLLSASHSQRVVEMESNHLGRRASSDDDAYWASLVEPEESLYSTVSDPEPDTNWLPVMHSPRLPAVDGYMAASLEESWRTAEVAPIAAAIRLMPAPTSITSGERR